MILVLLHQKILYLPMLHIMLVNNDLLIILVYLYFHLLDFQDLYSFHRNIILLIYLLLIMNLLDVLIGYYILLLLFLFLFFLQFFVILLYLLFFDFPLYALLLFLYIFYNFIFLLFYLQYV